MVRETIVRAPPRLSTRLRTAAVVMAVIIVGQARDNRPDPRDGVVLGLRSPLRVDRHVRRVEQPKIERQVRDVEEVSVFAEVGARRKYQSVRHAGFIETVEIAELGDRLAGRINDDDLIGLVGRDPDIVVRIEHEAVGAVDAVDEHRGRSRAAGGHRNLDDRVVAGIGDEQRVTGLVEAESVGAERRHAAVVSSGSCFQMVPTPPPEPVFQMMPLKESDT